MGIEFFVNAAGIIEPGGGISSKNQQGFITEESQFRSKKGALTEDLIASLFGKKGENAGELQNTKANLWLKGFIKQHFVDFQKTFPDTQLDDNDKLNVGRFISDYNGPPGLEHIHILSVVAPNFCTDPTRSNGFKAGVVKYNILQNDKIESSIRKSYQNIFDKVLSALNSSSEEVKLHLYDIGTGVFSPKDEFCYQYQGVKYTKQAGYNNFVKQIINEVAEEKLGSFSEEEKLSKLTICSSSIGQDLKKKYGCKIQEATRIDENTFKTKASEEIIEGSKRINIDPFEEERKRKDDDFKILIEQEKLEYESLKKSTEKDLEENLGRYLKSERPYIGWGITIEEDKEGNFHITNIVENGPAAELGLKAGDKIEVKDSNILLEDLIHSFRTGNIEDKVTKIGKNDKIAELQTEYQAKPKKIFQRINGELTLTNPNNKREDLDLDDENKSKKGRWSTRTPDQIERIKSDGWMEDSDLKIFSKALGIGFNIILEEQNSDKYLILRPDDNIYCNNINLYMEKGEEGNHFDYLKGGKISPSDPNYFNFQQENIVKVPGDGNCGFHAILMGLYSLSNEDKTIINKLEGFQDLQLTLNNPKNKTLQELLPEQQNMKNVQILRNYLYREVVKLSADTPGKTPADPTYCRLLSKDALAQK